MRERLKKEEAMVLVLDFAVNSLLFSNSAIDPIHKTIKIKELEGFKQRVLKDQDRNNLDLTISIRAKKMMKIKLIRKGVFQNQDLDDTKINQKHKDKENRKKS